MARRGLYTEDQWRWIADRYREGYTIYELADFVGVSYSTVAEHMRALGVLRGCYEKQPLRERAGEFNDLGYMARYMKEANRG